MCGRIFKHGVSWEEYASALDLFRAPESAPAEDAYSIAPTQKPPIIRVDTDEDSEAHNELIYAPAMWGLVPHSGRVTMLAHSLSRGEFKPLRN